MIISPILPIWAMAIICTILIFLVINKKILVVLRRLLIITLLFIINLRIMVPNGNTKSLTSDLNVFFVIDNTISMLAEDYNGKKTRLDAVKKDCEYILEELDGANYCLITFNDKSDVLTPLTKDGNMILGAIQTIKTPEELYAKGSSMNVVKDDLLDTLKSASKKEERRNIVFFISDGEITNDDDLESFSKLQKYVSNGAVLGYGTKKGGKMTVTDYDGNSDYMKDETSKSYPYPNAVSKLDEKNLKKIAKDLEIDYINMNSQDNINNKLEEIKKDALKNIDSVDKNVYADTYYIFAIPLFVLILLELIGLKKKEDKV